MNTGNSFWFSSLHDLIWSLQWKCTVGIIVIPRLEKRKFRFRELDDFPKIILLDGSQRTETMPSHSNTLSLILNIKVI